MCGVSLWKGYGIPINSDGTAKYNDERYFTPAAQIITSASKCPVPQDEDDETKRLQLIIKNHLPDVTKMV